MDNKSELESVDDMHDRRACIQLTLVGSSVIALALLFAAFALSSATGTIERIWVKFSALWFAGWWLLCHVMSGTKIRFVKENERE